MMWSTVCLFAVGFFGWVMIQLILHESAHLLAARLVGFSAFAVTIGTGPVLLRRRFAGLELRIHWLPLFGAVWIRPVLSGLAWRGGLFSSAGLLSDALLLAVLLNLVGFGLGSPLAAPPGSTLQYFLAFLALYQAAIIVGNLVPFEFTAHGMKIPNDGKQLLGYLRGRTPATLQAHEGNVTRYDPAFRLEDSWLMRCDVAILAAMTDAQEDIANGRYADGAQKHLRVIGERNMHPAEKAMLLDGIACIPLVHDAKALLPAAEIWARQACELLPHCRTVRGTLGAILVERDRYADGLALLMPLTSPENTQVDRIFASCFAAKALHRLGRSAEGRALLEKARSCGASHELYGRIEAELAAA
jgi:hypothetical protein